MSNGWSFVAGLALLGVLGLGQDAAAADEGRWKILQADEGYAWRVDTMTGVVEQCSAKGKCIAAPAAAAQGNWHAQIGENKRDVWQIDTTSGAMRLCSPVDAGGGRVMDPGMAASYKCTDMGGAQ